MITMKSIFIFILLLQIISAIEFNKKEAELKNFINKHIEIIKPLSREASLAYWEAATTGKPECYDKYSELQLKIQQIYNNPLEYRFLKNMKESGKIKDSILFRQLEILYNEYLENQMKPELLKSIIELSTEIEKNFSTFRGTINGNKVTNNEIDDILKSEKDNKKRESAWLASKQVAEVVSVDLIRLVKLRNEAAQDLGFHDYHEFSLSVDEQSVKEIDVIFHELYQLTNEPFIQIKSELDRILSNYYGISKEELMPWHYHDPFFQETPLVYQVNLDRFYQDKDIEELAKNFYHSLGLNVEPILEKSDLYERDGKNPHAFCTAIDREGDVRILCNVKNNERWMETMLHELGHAVYEKFQNPDTPYLLKTYAHIFTTEAIAMLFGRLSRNSFWMQKMLNLTDSERNEIEQVGNKYAQLKQIIFARWSLVMYDFEKELYADPDQDLNSLWWQLVKKYQLVNKPIERNKPDWAAKIHFSIAPCYYHNYLLGELLASQLHHHLIYGVLMLDSDRDFSYVNQKKIGEYLIRKVFTPGASLHWNEMIKQATGETLTAKYFVEQFIKNKE
jgi:peptidyl-dipeptidase A